MTAFKRFAFNRLTRKHLTHKHLTHKQLARLAPAAIALLAAAAPGARADEVRVLATGAVQHSVMALAERFEKETGHHVKATFGTAGAITAKFEAGEPADLLASSGAGLDALMAKGKLDGTVKPLGRVRIAVGVRSGDKKPDVSTADALKAALLAAPSLGYGDPAGGATTGVHFAKVLDKLGIAADVRAKSVLRPGGLEVMKDVADGKAALGITQASEILAVPGVEIAGYLPGDLQLVSTYAAAVTKDAKAPAAAQAFLAYLSGPNGLDTFRKAGFDTGATN